ncbi:MAG: threonine synthase [Candidatus Marinimicrobia bacterium]|nr:threonine synthase [Candidatus Neomarinimicrobiota bacterium]
MLQKKISLISTQSNISYPFERIEEFADNGESLEVRIDGIENAKIKEGSHIWERFVDFMPFRDIDPNISLGEGNTPLLFANQKLRDFCGLDDLYLKNETQNPTWSFKDRGSLTCIAMAKEMGEKVVATISTGNMGHSMAAYGAKAGLKVIVFVPHFIPDEKIAAISVHGAHIIKVLATDYSSMKRHVLGLANKLGLRIVTGNGPIRTEGYKLEAFELYEQSKGKLPDYIAIPTSACGHIRGVFKGFVELKQAGFINKLPKMIVVQAKNNSPIVSAIKQGKQHVIPFSNFHTIAEAITTGNPPGGDEIIDKAYKHGWLAEDVSEEEILISQKMLAESGFLVEPATATSLYAIKKLRANAKIKENESVVIMLTGSGLKDAGVLRSHPSNTQELELEKVESSLLNLVTHVTL